MSPSSCSPTASTSVEREVLDEWVRREHGDAEVIQLHDPASGDRRAQLDARVRAGDDPWLTPLRVVWLPPERDGHRVVRLRDVVLHLGDPRHPRTGPQRRITQEPPRPLPGRGGRAGPGVGAPQAVGHRERRRGRRRRRSPSSSPARPRSRSSGPSAGWSAPRTRCRASSARSFVARPLPRRRRATSPTSSDAPRRTGRRGGPLPRGDGHRLDRSCHRPRASGSARFTSGGATTRSSTTTPAQVARLREAARAAPARVPAEPQVEPRHLVLQYVPCTRTASRRTTPPAASTWTSCRSARSCGGAASSSSAARFKDNPVYKFVLRRVHRLPDREALLARVVHRGRALALRASCCRRARAARLRGRRLPARQARGRRADPGLDRLRPAPGRRRATPRSSAAASKQRRELRLVRRAAFRELRRRFGEIHIALRRAAVAARGARPARPDRRAEPGRAEPGAPEARLRGRGAHQPRRRRSRRRRS